jgi:hypothetical protein
MKFHRRQFLSSSLLAASGLPAAFGAPSESTEAPIVSLRGRVVCLTEELEKSFSVLPNCDMQGHVYALKAADGTCYPFLPVDTAAAIWLDERYRNRDLQIGARLFPANKFIEVIRFQSWVGGKLHDLYYYCDICAITANKPGACECCQEPVEFRETPAAQ